MEVLWVLSIFCFACMIHVYCEASEEDSVTVDDVLQTSFDLTTSESFTSEHVMTDQSGSPETGIDDMPVAWSILLRPSVVRTFMKLEEMIPLATESRYQILEDLIRNMNESRVFVEFSNCSSEMIWTRLIRYGASISKLLKKIQFEDPDEFRCTYTSRRQNPSRFGIIPPETPCPSTTEGLRPSSIKKPCPESHLKKGYSGSEAELDAIAPVVGSVRGIPGVHYPDYAEIPITNFSCADKKVPGFYADLDTGCQVFHVCYEHRRESFLCPIGTIFNQPILACDYWYSSNCSLAPLYYHTITKEGLQEESVDIDVEELVSILVESETEVEKEVEKTENVTLEDIAPFLPVKAVITELKPEKKSVPVKPVSVEDDLLASAIFDNIISSATKLTSKTRDAIGSIPEPEERYKPDLQEKLFAKSKIPLAKTKLAAVPASKGLAMKAAGPIVTKAKFAALPAKISKAKFAAAVPVATKAKVAIPAAKMAFTKGKLAAVSPLAAKAKVLPKVAVKAKMATGVPFAKAKLLAPVMKGKVIKGAGAPFLKAKAFGVPLAKGKLAGPIPLAKVKLGKAAAISPLTKKALALGYMKLLKGKKLAMMG